MQFGFCVLLAGMDGTLHAQTKFFPTPGALERWAMLAKEPPPAQIQKVRRWPQSSSLSHRALVALALLLHAWNGTDRMERLPTLLNVSSLWPVHKVLPILWMIHDVDGVDDWTDRVMNLSAHESALTGESLAKARGRIRGMRSSLEVHGRLYAAGILDQIGGRSRGMFRPDAVVNQEGIRKQVWNIRRWTPRWEQPGSLAVPRDLGFSTGDPVVIIVEQDAQQALDHLRGRVEDYVGEVWEAPFERRLEIQKDQALGLRKLGDFGMK